MSKNPQSIPPGVWVQLDMQPKIFVWHNGSQTLDIGVSLSGNVMTSAPCIFRIGPPSEANVENKT